MPDTPVADPRPARISTLFAVGKSRTFGCPELRDTSRVLEPRAESQSGEPGEAICRSSRRNTRPDAKAESGGRFVNTASSEHSSTTATGVHDDVQVRTASCCFLSATVRCRSHLRASQAEGRRFESGLEFESFVALSVTCIGALQVCGRGWSCLRQGEGRARVQPQRYMASRHHQHDWASPNFRSKYDPPPGQSQTGFRGA